MVLNEDSVYHGGYFRVSTQTLMLILWPCWRVTFDVTHDTTGEQREAEGRATGCRALGGSKGSTVGDTEHQVSFSAWRPFTPLAGSVTPKLVCC